MAPGLIRLKLALSTDAYMIILLRTLELNDEELIQGLQKGF